MALGDAITKSTARAGYGRKTATLLVSILVHAAGAALYAYFYFHGAEELPPPSVGVTFFSLAAPPPPLPPPPPPPKGSPLAKRKPTQPVQPVEIHKLTPTPKESEKAGEENGDELGQEGGV